MILLAMINNFDVVITMPNNFDYVTNNFNNTVITIIKCQSKHLILKIIYYSNRIIKNIFNIKSLG